MMRFLVVIICSLAFISCQYEEKEREIGYKGEAKKNHYLALERYIAEVRGEAAENRKTWFLLDRSHAMLVLPKEQVASRTTADRIREWVSDGGHAVFLLNNVYGDVKDDFFPPDEASVAMKELIEDARIEFEEKNSGERLSEFSIGKRTYDVEMNSFYGMKYDSKISNHPILSMSYGEGTMTFVSDANFLKNRKIDQRDHAEIVQLWLDWSRDGKVIFLQGVELSFWGMLWREGWMALIALAVLVAFWLLRHMPRFGPLQASADEPTLRNYDHYLEMIGEFHWRTSRCMNLLEPMRNEVIEQCRHWQQSQGLIDEGIFEVISRRTGIPFERVQRAMSEPKPFDSLIFTRTVTDLQTIKKTFT